MEAPDTAPPDLPPTTALSPPGPAEPLSPWFSIWTRPRATLRWILDSSPRRHVKTLAMLGGVASGMAAARTEIAADLPPLAVLGGALLGGALGGLIGVYLMGVLLRITGRWIGGRGDWSGVRAAVAWSQVPAIWAILLWLPRVALLEGEVFHPDPAAVQDHPASAIALMLIELTQGVAAVWQFVVSLKCLGEAHSFSAWRSLLALILAVIAVVVPIVILALLLGVTGLLLSA